MHFGFGGVLLGSKWLLAAKELHRGVPLLPAPKSNQGFRNPIGFNDFGHHIIITHPRPQAAQIDRYYIILKVIKRLSIGFEICFWRVFCTMYFLQDIIMHECKHDYQCSCTISPYIIVKLLADIMILQKCDVRARLVPRQVEANYKEEGNSKQEKIWIVLGNFPTSMNPSGICPNYYESIRDLPHNNFRLLLLASYNLL